MFHEIFSFFGGVGPTSADYENFDLYLHSKTFIFGLEEGLVFVIALKSSLYLPLYFYLQSNLYFHLKSIIFGLKEGLVFEFELKSYLYVLL